LEFLRKVTAPLPFAVLAVFPRVDNLRLAHQFLDLLLQLRLCPLLRRSPSG
jgi:hypothetical protein